MKIHVAAITFVANRLSIIVTSKAFKLVAKPKWHDYKAKRVYVYIVSKNGWQKPTLDMSLEQTVVAIRGIVITTFAFVLFWETILCWM